MKYVIRIPNGPAYSYTLDEIREEYRNGNLPDDSSVRRQDKEECQTLRELLEPLGDFRHVNIKESNEASAPAISIDISGRVSGRYRDGYLLARATSGTGGVIKITGTLLALSAFIASPLLVPHKDGGIVIIIGISILGLISGVLLYILGVLLAAFGQVLKATLDQAVNCSPFLTDHQRAIAMSLYY